MASTAYSMRFAHPGLRQLLSPRSSILDLAASRASPIRRYTSSPLLRAARPQAPKPPNSVVAPPKSIKKDAVAAAPAAPAPPAPSTSYAFIKSLAGKATPTTLYEAPSHFWFYFGCWSSGIGILSWSALTGPTLITQPGSTPTWVTITYAASYVILCTMGFYLISRTHNIVSLIRVMPGKAMAKTSQAAPAVKMELVVKSMLPFVGPKTISTDSSKVNLRSRFSLPEDLVPALRREAIEKQKETQKELHKFDMNHLLTMPFRRLGRAAVALFNGVRGAWTDMGFGKLRIDGKEYKVDVTNGFAHDGFRTLEKLVQMDGR